MVSNSARRCALPLIHEVKAPAHDYVIRCGEKRDAPHWRHNEQNDVKQLHLSTSMRGNRDILFTCASRHQPRLP